MWCYPWELFLLVFSITTCIFLHHIIGWNWETNTYKLSKKGLLCLVACTIQFDLKTQQFSSLYMQLKINSCFICSFLNFSLSKQLTFGDATTGFPAKCHLRNERRNSMLMMHHHPDLVSASDWLNQISHRAQPIRSTAQICIVTRHQYGISGLVSQTPFGSDQTSGSIAKCWLFLRLSTLKSLKYNPTLL